MIKILDRILKRSAIAARVETHSAELYAQRTDMDDLRGMVVALVEKEREKEEMKKIKRQV